MKSLRLFLIVFALFLSTYGTGLAADIRFRSRWGSGPVGSPLCGYVPILSHAMELLYDRCPRMHLRAGQ